VKTAGRNAKDLERPVTIVIARLLFAEAIFARRDLTEWIASPIKPARNDSQRLDKAAARNDYQTSLRGFFSPKQSYREALPHRMDCFADRAGSQ